MTTPHKSFEERVDEVIGEVASWSEFSIDDIADKAKAALLALLNEARLDEVLMARELIPTYPNNIDIATGRATRAGLYFIKRIDELRANLTDDHEGLSDRVGW